MPPAGRELGAPPEMEDCTKSVAEPAIDFTLSIESFGSGIGRTRMIASMIGQP